MWRVSKYDFFLWLFIFVMVILLGPIYGFYCGMAPVIFMTFMDHKQPHVFGMGRTAVPFVPRIGHPFVYLERLRHVVQEVPGTKVIGIYGPLNFGTLAHVREEIYRIVGLDAQTRKKLEPVSVSREITARNQKTDHLVEVSFLVGQSQVSMHEVEAKIRYVIIDASLVTHFDYSGESMLQRVKKDLGLTLGVNTIIVSRNPVISEYSTIHAAFEYIGSEEDG